VREELDEVAEARTASACFDEVGDLLFAAVGVARKLDVDPELALRAAAQRFRGRVEAAAELAGADGQSWRELSPERRLELYDRARDADAPGRP
jgi:uncharacterized protein YabN with tetrapyrrole methylase and pyrophosphatase domain